MSGVRPPDRHPIDGREMTVGEIAEMLGTTIQALRVRRSNMGGVSYQTIVDMFRANMLQTRTDRWNRHFVEGRWITVADAAEMVGVKQKSIREWRATHRHQDGTPGTLAEAVAYYRQYQTGERTRYHGRKAKVYRVGKRRLTIYEAARECGSTPNALRQSMRKYRRTLGEAMQHAGQVRQRKAELEILRILEGNT